MLMHALARCMVGCRIDTGSFNNISKITFDCPPWFLNCQHQVVTYKNEKSKTFNGSRSKIVAEEMSVLVCWFVWSLWSSVKYLNNYMDSCVPSGWIQLTLIIHRLRVLACWLNWSPVLYYCHLTGTHRCLSAAALSSLWKHNDQVDAQNRLVAWCDALTWGQMSSCWCH